jgi:(S)-2-hydroxyglutarate dehydrogenase
VRWDVAVVGGGVVGLATARALALRGERVLLLEKEAALGQHQSGRNSGVVHAGATYKPGTLRARLAVRGAEALRAFCQEHGVPLEEVGKVWVARGEGEAATLERLRAQGQANGVQGLRLLDASGLHEVEPHVAGIAALHSPRSAIVDAGALVRALAEDARGAGATLALGQPLRAAAREGTWTLRTSSTTHEADRVVTCGGLHSDRIARMFGAEHPYHVVPFRGAYKALAPSRQGLVRGLVYPVPDARFPFVGIHLTKRTDGSVLVGPTALLALGREAYAHALHVQPRDLAAMAGARGFWAMLGRGEVRAHARVEAARAASPARFLRETQALLPSLGPGDLVPARSGIRAQLVDARGHFVDDLVLLEQDGAVHVLNAVSPGLTSCLALAGHVAEKVR